MILDIGLKIWIERFIVLSLSFMSVVWLKMVRIIYKMFILILDWKIVWWSFYGMWNLKIWKCIFSFVSV